MFRQLSLRQFFDRSQVFVRWRLCPKLMAATVVCLTLVPRVSAQHRGPAEKPAAPKIQPAKEPQVRDRDKLLAEHQQLLDEETKLSGEQKYAEAIRVSEQREAVLIDLAKIPDLKPGADQERLNLLQQRANRQYLSGAITEAVKTGEKRLQLTEQEFGAKDWQSVTARFHLDYFRKLAVADEPTRARMRELEHQANAASAKRDYQAAIARTDALKEIEAQVLGVEHPFYANSLSLIAVYCLQSRDYERAAKEWQATLVIRRKAYGDEHPEVIDCHDGLAAVARQQREWTVARGHYGQTAPERRALFGTMSPDDPAVWIDDFASDSREQYTVAGNVIWDAGRLSLPQGASVGRSTQTGSAWEVVLELAFPPAIEKAETGEVRFEFTLDGDPAPYSVIWKTEVQDGMPKARLQFCNITREPAGVAKTFPSEKVKVLREAEWQHGLSGRWSLNWNHGWLQVRHGEQSVLEGYVDSIAVCGPWTLRAVSGSVAVADVGWLGTTRREFTSDEQQRLVQARKDNQTVFQLYAEAKYAEVVTLASHVLEIRRKLLGEDHPDTATSLNNLALLYDSQGNYATAEPLLQRALKTREKALGPDHPDTAQSLNNLADVYNSQSNYVAAEPLYQRALKIWEKTFGPDYPNTVTSLSNLAFLYSSQQNYAAAEPLLQRALKIREKAPGPDHPDTAQSLHHLALLYDSQGNYAAAEPLYRRALKIREKTVGPDHSDTATSLNHLALLYSSQGNYTAAEPLHRQALKIREKALGPDHPDTAQSLINLAELHRVQGNYAAAEPLYLRTLKIWENAFGPNDPLVATGLNNLALLYYSQENYAAAKPLHQRALKIREKVLGPDHPDTAVSLINLGFLYESQGNYAAAEPLHHRALEICEKARGPDHPLTATSLNNLAVFHWQRGEPKSALTLAERAMQIRLRHLDQTAAIQTEQQQFLMQAQVRHQTSSWLTVSQADSQQTPAVYRDLLTWKGLITARQIGLRQSLRDDPLFAEFRRVGQQLSTVTLSPPLPPSDPKALEVWSKREPELRQQWQAEKERLEVDHERIERALAAKSVVFRQSLEQRQVQPEDLRAVLREQTRPTALVDLLEYHYFGRQGEKDEDRIAAFIVRGDQEVARVELGSAESLHQELTAWRQSFGRASAEHDPGRKLRQRLWEPLQPQLVGIETVLISPDGVLAQLPWGALPGKEPGKYLLEEVFLAVIPVPQQLPQLLRRERVSGPPASLLLAGDIDYGGDPGLPQDLLANRAAVGRQRDGKFLEFASLGSEAQGELASIERRYRKKVPGGQVDSLDRSDATEAAFREQAAQHQWLHVITHGYFAPPSLTAGLRAAGERLGTPGAPITPPTVTGIGAGLELKEGKCFVTQLVAAGAAQKDGRLKVGDEILSVAQPNGEPVLVADKTLAAIVALTRGPVGTKVVLQVRPQSDPQQTREIELTRASLPSQMTNTQPVAVHPGLLSGLAFAGANTPPAKDKDDGVLTALEVAALDLNQVDAVVLSACETGLGEVAGGEGLLGLQRSFQVSGARTVVASLWKVPNAATARLMQRFYENLWDKKLPKLEALREAQIWMMHDQGDRGAVLEADRDATVLPPYYWAAFVLSGDWR